MISGYTFGIWELFDFKNIKYLFRDPYFPNFIIFTSLLTAFL